MVSYVKMRIIRRVLVVNTYNIFSVTAQVMPIITGFFNSLVPVPEFFDFIESLFLRRKK